MLTKTLPEGVIQFVYDTAAHGIGKLASVTSLHGSSETMQYDNLGRLQNTIRTIGAQSFQISQTYDYLGRPSTLSYPTGYKIQNIYNALGYLHEIRSWSDAALLWKQETRNARGQSELQSYGNGLQIAKTYDPATSFLQSVQSGTVQSGSVQHLTFGFDAIGNLTSRSDVRIGKSEVFTYDTLNRLKSSEVNGQMPVTVSYDALGNITQRSDVGTYTYGQNGAGPHAVTSIAGMQSNTFQYDAAGNRISSVGGSVQYDSMGQAYRMIDGNTQIDFDYDGLGGRIEQRLSSNGALQKTTQYIGGIFERRQSASEVENVHYITGPDGLVAIRTTSNAAPDKLSYVLHDHLGSIQTIVDHLGAIVEVLSFDSWGKRRDAQTWAAANVTATSEVTRGFTGHEQLDDVKLIHMNGRVYDPAVGRFLSADPFVQEPENLQSLNRYSYVLNNPLSFTDPSGFFLKKLFKSALKIAVVAIAAYTGNVALAGVLKGSLIAVGIKGVAVGIMTSIAGSVVSGTGFSAGLKAGLRNAANNFLRAVVANAIGDYFDTGIRDGYQVEPGAGAKWAEEHTRIAKAVAHGLSQAAFAKTQNSSVLGGFASGAVGDYFGGDDSSIGTILVALIGGAASALAGGRFDEGALHAVFIHLYNHLETHNLQDDLIDVILNGAINNTNEAMMVHVRRAMILYRHQRDFEAWEDLWDYFGRLVSLQYVNPYSDIGPARPKVGYDFARLMARNTSRAVAGGIKIGKAFATAGATTYKVLADIENNQAGAQEAKIYRLLRLQQMAGQ